MTSRLRRGHLASTRALLFALLRLFRASGISWLLAPSAGATLAEEGPTWFVIAGLWDLAVALLLAAAIGLALALRRVGVRAVRLMVVLSCLGGACLLLRGLAVEMVLLTPMPEERRAMSVSDGHM